MKNSWTRSFALAVIITACGGEKTTEPTPQATPPAALRLVFADTVTRGQAFALTITALDAQGQTNASWSGAVSLTASAGSISPATVNITSGTVTVQATIGQHAGSISITSTVGTATGSRSAMVLSGQPVARLEIHPQTFLLTGAGVTQQLGVRVLDADGLPTTSTGVTWQSAKAGVVAMSASGVATATGAGSSSITARVGATTSDPALAYVTTPAAGVVLVADDQITGGITPVNPQARYGPGWQYRVRMTGTPPQVGHAVASRGEKPIAGRVIGVQSAGATGSDVTLQLVPLSQLFPNLSIDESGPLRFEPLKQYHLATRTRAPWAAAIAEDTMTFGAFKCGYKIDVASNNPFALSGISFDLTPTLQYIWIYNSTRKKLVVQGGLTGSLKATPTVTAALNGSFECKAELGNIPIPIGGAIGALLGARIPLGVGFAFEGGITLATLGFDIELAAATTIAMGVDCNPGCLQGRVFSLTGTASGNVKPNLPQISSDFRVTAGVSGYVWADLEMGPTDLIPNAQNYQLTLLESKAGLKQDFNLSTADVQSADPDYASNYSLAPFFSGGVPDDLQAAIDSLLGMAGIGLPAFKYEATGTKLADSPAGSFQIIPARVRAATPSYPGDSAQFIVNLSRVNYLTFYAIESVNLYRKPAIGSLSPAPGSCASISPSSTGQSLFTCKTTLPSTMVGQQTFYAFVKPKFGNAVLPVLLEVASDSKATVMVDTSRIVYETDFSGAVIDSVWSIRQARTSPTGQRFLGSFANTSVNLNLANIPIHTALMVEFDVYFTGGWDGRDRDVFTVQAPGQTLLNASFSNHPADQQSYPNALGGQLNPAGTGAFATNSLGFPPEEATGFLGDTIYRLKYTFNHTGGSLALQFRSMVSDPVKELFGIDNVRVTIP